MHPQGGPPSRSSDSGRSLGALCHLYTIYIHAKGGQQASEETGDRTTQLDPPAELPTPLFPAHTQSPAWLLKPGSFVLPGRLTPYGAGPVPPREGPVSEQRQRSLFGSPLLPLHNIHSCKGRTTSERRDGGPDDTTMCTGSAPPSPPPTPKARLGFSSRAAFVLPGMLTHHGAAPVPPQGGPPSRSSDSGRSLGALCYLYTIYIQAKGGQQASEETGDRTTPPSAPAHAPAPLEPPKHNKAGLDRQARLLLLLK
ncbi:hypothetical protein J2Z18_005601 [Paenibacillus lactis]|uniref:Uncharacterized protein n=1 Tax=Paenibacillus lactis TaxID=228574 RepID=A0ABS4FJN5_9BACL|nr:hypothetical protein [Paenibacillus lactis]